MAARRKTIVGSRNAYTQNLVRAVKVSTGSAHGVLDRVGRAKHVKANKAAFKSKAKALYAGYKADIKSYYPNKV